MKEKSYLQKIVPQIFPDVEIELTADGEHSMFIPGDWINRGGSFRLNWNRNGELYYNDCVMVDHIHRWSVFMLQWPSIAFSALIGHE